MQPTMRRGRCVICTMECAFFTYSLTVFDSVVMQIRLGKQPAQWSHGGLADGEVRLGYRRGQTGERGRKVSSIRVNDWDTGSSGNAQARGCVVQREPSTLRGWAQLDTSFCDGKT